MLTNKDRVVVWALTVAAAAAALAAGPVLAETFYIRPDGNDQAAGTTAKDAFRTILRAAGRMNHGDGIVIAPGVYRDSALLAERFSADGAQMSVVGDEAGKAFGVPAGAVVIEPAAGAQGAAMEFFRFRNLRIAGLTFRGPGQGLRLEQCKDVLVERCTFTGLTRGLAAESVEGLRVESSVFARCTVGVFLHGVTAARLAHDSLAGCSSVGVLVLGCGQGAIRNCLQAGNNTSIIADRISAAGWTSDGNVVHGACGPWGDVPVVANMYEWFAASGQDRRSVHVVPAFADAAACDLHIAPAVGWGGGLPGMDVGRPLDPKVELDRDGHAFRVRGGGAAGAAGAAGSAGTVCAGAYDYPDPAAAGGWAKLGVALPALAGGPRQSAGIYAEDGSLIRTLLADAAGAAELWWDGRDDLGKPAPAGKYLAKTAVGDVRIVDDGAFGDDGNPMGAYNCDNADRVAALADGGFVVTTIYDEGGYPLRRYSSSGQPTFASNLADKDFAAITMGGEDLYAVVGKGAAAAVVRLTLPGNRAKMASGADGYPVFAAGEKAVEAAGLAVAGGKAYVALPGTDVIRVIDLATGAKVADLPLPGVGDLAVDPKGTLWAVAGTDVVTLDLAAGGKPTRRIATQLTAPRYLAASADRLAVVDRKAQRLAVIDPAAEGGSGKVLRTIGKAVPAGEWVPVGPDVLCDPRGAAFLRDGRLVLTEHARVRILYPDTGVVCQDLLSNFMDIAVVHPTKTEYVYCWPGAFRVDPATGAWQWLVQAPEGKGPPGKDGKPTSLSYGSPSTSVALGGRAYVAYYNSGHLRMVDVTEPLRPRLALDVTSSKGGVLEGWAYSTITFTKGGDLVGGANYKQSFAVAPFKGLDAQNNPIFDFDAGSRKVGPGEDPSPRGMKPIGALAADTQTGDFYYLAVTAYNNKMVPAWGADGTGVGRTNADGKPLWFAPSSGGNYMSIGAARSRDRMWVLAGKSFGGQIDLFDADGLRLATGNWAWPCHYNIGFVDMRFGVQAYLRPDGKVGAYVEDDAIGRFARCRIDGAATLKTASTPVDWKPSAPSASAQSPAAAPAGVPALPVASLPALPTAHEVASAGAGLAAPLLIPKIPALKMDGDWSAWAKAGVVPQIVALPVIGFHRNVPDDLWQTFRQATGIGAIAHDGTSLLVYFLVADDTMHFDADNPGRMWEFDSVELWLEEEQIGLGMVRDGTPSLFKYRYHNLAGKEWSANYGLPRQNVWAEKIADLSTHPLGKQLQSVTGASLAGRPGYAVAGRIPFAEVKLVGGIAGRSGKDIVDMTGKPGEIIRIGVSFGGICEAGREQDFKVNWPSTMMFSDPTRSTPFVFGN